MEGVCVSKALPSSMHLLALTTLPLIPHDPAISSIFPLDFVLIFFFVVVDVDVPFH